MTSPDYRAWRDNQTLQEKWVQIAARDGAITIFNFGKSYEAVRASLKTCPALIPFVDETKLEAAGKKLRERFPRFEAVRHTVAHAAEFHRNENQMKAHAYAAGPTSLFISGMLDGRTFSGTYENEIFSYEVSKETLVALIEVVRLTYTAFPHHYSPNIKFAPVNDPDGVPLLFDIYVDDEWIGSRRTSEQCDLAALPYRLRAGLRIPRATS